MIGLQGKIPLKWIHGWFRGTPRLLVHHVGSHKGPPGNHTWCGDGHTLQGAPKIVGGLGPRVATGRAVGRCQILRESPWMSWDIVVIHVIWCNMMHVIDFHFWRWWFFLARHGGCHHEYLVISGCLKILGFTPMVILQEKPIFINHVKANPIRAVGAWLWSMLMIDDEVIYLHHMHWMNTSNHIANKKYTKHELTRHPRHAMFYKYQCCNINFEKVAMFGNGQTDYWIFKTGWFLRWQYLGMLLTCHKWQGPTLRVYCLVI